MFRNGMSLVLQRTFGKLDDFCYERSFVPLLLLKQYVR